MTASLATEVLPAAALYCATTYEAFRVGNVSATKTPKWRTYVVDIAGYLLPDLEAAKNAALISQSFDRGDQLIIREIGDQGVQLHLFSIKQRSAPTYVPDPDSMTTKRVNRMYADPLCVVDGGVMAL